MKNTINEAIASLKPRDKDPHSVSVLARWIAEAGNQMEGGRSGRLSWLVASVVATAKPEHSKQRQPEGPLMCYLR